MLKQVQTIHSAQRKTIHKSRIEYATIVVKMGIHVITVHKDTMLLRLIERWGWSYLLADAAKILLCQTYIFSFSSLSLCNLVKSVQNDQCSF